MAIVMQSIGNSGLSTKLILHLHALRAHAKSAKSKVGRIQKISHLHAMQCSSDLGSLRNPSTTPMETSHSHIADTSAKVAMGWFSIRFGFCVISAGFSSSSQHSTFSFSCIRNQVWIEGAACRLQLYVMLYGSGRFAFQMHCIRLCGCLDLLVSRLS